MNVIKLKVNFKNRICTKIGVPLTSGDYNSTKIIFDFDIENGSKVFEMSDPNGNLLYVNEIESNELILVGKDKNNQPCSLFSSSGKYKFEISLYEKDSKLTSATNYIDVKQEQIVVDDKIVEAYLPVFDSVINEYQKAKTELNNLNIDINNSTITITKKDGTLKSVDVKGDMGPEGPKGDTGEKGEVGLTGPIGPKGKDGTDGKTPIKGTDYWTDSDKQEIVDDTTNTLTPVLNQNLQTSKQYTDNQIVNDIKEVIYDEASATFTFVKHDNTTIVVDLPIETMVKSGYYDEETKELVLVLENNQEIRIPASGLIDDYTGQDTVTIQCSISAENVITCNIKSGSISKTLLTAELQSELNNKVNSDVLNNYDTSSEVTSKIATATPYASETAKGMIKVWTSTNEEGEIGLNISTEV